MHARPALAALAVVATLAAAACTSTPGTTSAAPRPTTTAAPTGYAVTTRAETYVDHSRPTPAISGLYPGAPSRTLHVLFFVPHNRASSAATTQYPLFLFSHGLTGTPEGYTPLLTAIASHGYLVAAPAYPLTNGNAPRGNTAGDLANQPGDVSFVLDRVLAQSTQPGWMHGLVDPNRIAVGGHSLGAMTTYGVAFNTCCRDPRIKAGVVLDGVAAGFPDAKYFTGIRTPLLAVHGDHDETLDISAGRAAFDRANSPKYFMTIVGGKHSSDARGGDSPGQRALTAAVLGFLDNYLRGDAQGLVRMRQAAQTPGVSTLDARP